jgi:hypothetical protein
MEAPQNKVGTQGLPAKVGWTTPNVAPCARKRDCQAAVPILCLEKEITKPMKTLAGGLGFEPRQAESESAVLPLDDPPSRWARRRRAAPIRLPLFSNAILAAQGRPFRPPPLTPGGCPDSSSRGRAAAVGGCGADRGSICTPCQWPDLVSAGAPLRTAPRTVVARRLSAAATARAGTRSAWCRSGTTCRPR